MLTNKYEIRFFAALGTIVFILLAIIFFVGNKVINNQIPTPIKITVNPFDGIELTARSAYVLDARTGKTLYSKNDSQRLPLASLAKVMTALVAANIAPPTSTITITRTAVETAGDSGLQVGEKWSLKKLTDFSLTSSSNDGARAIALALGNVGNLSDTTASTTENDFVKEMNREAKNIGMTESYYLNDTGLDQSVMQGGAYGTARDMATLFDYILKNHPGLMEATREATFKVTSASGVVHTVKNTDAIVNTIPGLIASKTGYTDLAGGNLVIAFDPEIGRPIIISILGSTEVGRFEDMTKLVEASLESIQNNIQSSK